MGECEEGSGGGAARSQIAPTMMDLNLNLNYFYTTTLFSPLFSGLFPLSFDVVSFRSLDKLTRSTTPTFEEARTRRRQRQRPIGSTK